MAKDLTQFSIFPYGLPMIGTSSDPESIGYIYVIGLNEPGIVKIGSATCVSLRMAALQGGNPFELFLRYAVSVYSGNLISVEKAAHRLVDEHRIRGEWFAISDKDALLTVLKAARNAKAKVGSCFAAEQKMKADRATYLENVEIERRKALRVRLGMEA